MKKTIYIFLALMSVVLIACDKHDNLDDLVFVGKMPPQVYWEVNSTAVNAGQDVPFSAQYYTTGESAISHCEVWYNVIETTSKQVSAPFVKSFSYTVSSTSEVEQRISQCIKRYPHDEAYWSDSLRAYVLEDNFPTSNTLGKLSWGATEYSEDYMNTYFGDGFMSSFKDSLEQILKADVDKSYVDYKSLCDALGYSEMFEQYVDSAFNENTDSYDKFFVNHELPAEVDQVYQNASFADLINSSTGYSVSYTKQYSMVAVLKCVDENGVAGVALTKELSFN